MSSIVGIATSLILQGSFTNVSYCWAHAGLTSIERIQSAAMGPTVCYYCSVLRITIRITVRVMIVVILIIIVRVILVTAIRVIIVAMIFVIVLVEV